HRGALRATAQRQAAHHRDRGAERPGHRVCDRDQHHLQPELRRAAGNRKLPGANRKVPCGGVRPGQRAGGSFGIVTLVIGCLLGLGVLLAASPFLWPKGSEAEGARPGASSRGRMFLSSFQERIWLAGLHKVSIGGLAVISLLLGLVVGAVTLALVPVLALAAAAGLLAVVAPAALINWRAAARRRAGRVLWPDLVDHLVSAVRSGLALRDSVVTLAHSGPEPTREAFAQFEREYRATANFSACI